jgi:hypothetical protein
MTDVNNSTENTPPSPNLIVDTEDWDNKWGSIASPYVF